MTSLINSVPSASNVNHYAEIVRKKHVLRNLIEASQHLTDLSYKEDEDVEHILDEAERKIFGISKNALEHNWETLKKKKQRPGELGFRTKSGDLVPVEFLSNYLKL